MGKLVHKKSAPERLPLISSNPVASNGHRRLHQTSAPGFLTLTIAHPLVVEMLAADGLAALPGDARRPHRLQILSKSPVQLRLINVQSIINHIFWLIFQVWHREGNNSEDKNPTNATCSGCMFFLGP